MKRIAICWSALLLSLQAAAHEGHGLAASHGHGEDLWSLLALCLAVAVGVGFFRGGGR